MSHWGVPRRGVRRDPEDFIIEDHDELTVTEEVRVPTVRAVEVQAKYLNLMIQIPFTDAHEQERPLGTALRGHYRGSPGGIAQLSLTTTPR